MPLNKKDKKDPFYLFEQSTKYSSSINPNEELRLMYPIEGVLDIAPNSYYITSYGKVYTTVKNNGTRLYEVHVTISPDGYKVIDLGGINNTRNHLRINRLVAFFYKPFDFNNQLKYNDLEVDHINGNSMNNHWSNLRWLTHDLNMEARKIKFSCSEEEWKNYVIKNTLYDYRDMNSYLYGMQESTFYIEREIQFAESVYYEAIKGLTPFQLCLKYNCSLEKINRIINLETPFNSFLYEEAKRKKPKRITLPDEIIISIYYMCRDNVPIRIIEEKFHCSDSVISNIKFCRNGYEYLMHRYGFEPLPCCFGLDEAIVVEIYLKFYNGAKTNYICNKYNISDDTAARIKFCRGIYNFLTTKYGFEPLHNRKE